MPVMALNNAAILSLNGSATILPSSTSTNPATPSNKLALGVDAESGVNYTGAFNFKTSAPNATSANDLLQITHTSAAPDGAEATALSLSVNGLTVPTSVSTPQLLIPGIGNINAGGNSLIVQPTTPAGAVMLNWNGGSTGGTLFGNGNSATVASVSSTGVITGSAKNFRIVHPLDDTKYLTHSCIEGPEYAVFYRGEGQCVDGRATVALPDYFETLVMAENRTVILTPLFEDDEDNPIALLAAGRVFDGHFSVRAQGNDTQKFYWEVKAVRADISPLEVETDIPPQATPSEGKKPRNGKGKKS
jgi:hypothetical protein